jgi:phospholipid-binding lipoprotein MlaA
VSNVFLSIRAQGIRVVPVLALSLSACAAPPASGVNDPYENVNRSFHGFNVAVDKALVRPTSTAYGTILPDPVERGIANFANNLDTPSDIVNGALQGRPDAVGQNMLRFGLNSTFGVLGLFDFASAIGVPARKTDFGETLHVWGVGEGAYQELPLLGPSTERDTAGTIVDVFLNPVSAVLPSPESYYASAAKVGSKLGDRNRFKDTVDSVLYDSADSYAQARLLYLQNRRFELGQGAGADATAADDEAFLDPYEDDPYAE